MTQIICVFLCFLSRDAISCMHIMTAQLVYTTVVMQSTTACHMIFTGGTCINMSENGFAVASVYSFKSLQPSHGPMQLRLYQYLFQALGVLCRRTHPFPSGSRWILIAVCPYSNYLRAIPVPDKTATTAANALFHYVFLQLGFPTVLQSDHDGEFLNALLHRITQLLSI